MIGKITYFYKDGRKMTARTAAGTAREIVRHAKETLATYKNAGAAGYEIVGEDGKPIA